jgi:transposase-like protein
MSALSRPHFQDANKAREYLEATRWPNGPICPHCGVIGDHYQLDGKAHRRGLWKCHDCREQFSVTVGTVFERSKIALNVWLQAVYLLCSSKKGMSSHQLHRTLGVTYKTAWFMSHRIREAFRDGSAGPIGGGGKIVEADETFWGTITGMTPKRKGRGGGWRHKHKILALVERDGRARSFHVANVTHETLKPILQSQIAKDSHLMTDAASHYRTLKGGFLSHETVNHARKQYAKKSRAIKGEVAHSNTVESYFGIFKRGLMGTYHHVSEAHLQRYCTEFDFRFSYRTAQGFDDAQRANIALKQIGGKRLLYKGAHQQPPATLA